jgi:hypothetical protein
MQNRTSVLSFIVVAVGTAALLATTANSQLGAPKNYVSLQPTTPGTSQSGHSNITGNGLFGGKVGIGTMAPTHTVHIAKPEPTLALQDTDSTTQQVGYVSYRDSGNIERAWVGYGSTGDPNFSIVNTRQGGDIVLSPFAGDVTVPTGTVSIGTSTPGPYDLQVIGSSTVIYGHSISTLTDSVGVLGRSSSPQGIGVYGHATAFPNGVSYGGFFESASRTGTGVFGICTGEIGVNYGVRGVASSASAFAVYGVGNLGASGTKSFRIDHPFDPENKYLLHYCSESPMPQNFYVGNVVTDAKGYAWVELPNYFAEINANFKYQLTVVDDSESATFVQVKVGRKIRGNRFLIMSSAPNVEISWRVDADRNDLYVRSRKPEDVVEKQGRERGTYQHPELYGMPKERGMDYRPEIAEKPQLPRK